MKLIFATATVLGLGAALLGGVAAQPSPAARNISAWTSLPQATRAEPAALKDETVKAAEGSIDIPPDQIEAQGIEIAPVKKGILARRLTVPGTIALDMDMVARVPGRVVGTVTEMRKRLGDPVAKGEVVAVLDSREVADAKSEYLTASVDFDLRKTMFERAQTLWAKKISAEQQYLQSRAAFLEAELRLDLARQKLSALKLDPAEVEKAAKQESALKSGVSSLREYEIRSLIAGRVIERKVDVGALIGNQGDPSDLYTVADLSLVWVELTAPIVDLDMIEEGQMVEIASARVGGKRGIGRIIFISPLVDPETRSARVIAQIDNKASIWRPGSTVLASIVIGEEQVEVLVPRLALQTISGEHVVFVRNQQGFQRRAVMIGRSDEQAAEIVSGLSAGEQIAVKNTFLLKAELGKGEAGDAN